MTRTFVCKLVSAAKIYNLWDDIIKPSDPTFSDIPFIPSMVSNFQAFFPLTGPNSAGNVGNTVSVTDNLGYEMRNMIPGDLFQKAMLLNTINLKTFNFQGSADNEVVEVTVSSN